MELSSYKGFGVRVFTVSYKVKNLKVIFILQVRKLIGVSLVLSIYIIIEKQESMSVTLFNPKGYYLERQTHGENFKIVNFFKAVSEMGKFLISI